MIRRSITVAISLAALSGLPVHAADTAGFKAEVANPMTVAIRHSMEQRHSRLVKFYEPGAIGLAKDGMVAMTGDATKIKLATRQIIEKLIDAENDDRRQFLAAVAIANGDGHDLTRARSVWLAHWREAMHKGWMIQDDTGHWAPKP